VLVAASLWRKFLLASTVVILVSGTIRAQVSYERILGASGEPENWLTYSGGYAGWRHSGLDQINVGNVSRLSLAWAFQAERKAR